MSWVGADQRLADLVSMRICADLAAGYGGMRTYAQYQIGRSLFAWTKMAVCIARPAQRYATETGGESTHGEVLLFRQNG